MEEKIKTMFDEPGEGEREPENSAMGHKREEASE